MKKKANISLPGTKQLAGNTIWNLVGMILPMVIALWAIPVLANTLGPARFGTLTLAWLLVGYFSIFDLGLSRALTKMAAEYLGAKEEEKIPALFWTSMLLMLVLGLTLAVLFGAFSWWLVGTLLKIPTELEGETLRAFTVVAFGLPVVISTTGLIGLLEAYQKFRLINFVRLFTGTFIFVGPVFVLPFSQSLFPVISVLVVGRVLEWLVYFVLCLTVVRQVNKRVNFDRSLLLPLFSFGGWMTVSNIIVPLILQVDRFVIGAVVSVAQLAFYATPSEIVLRLLVFPRSLVSVLFPAIAAYYRTERKKTADLFGQSVSYLTLGLYPIVLVMVMLAPEGLTIWLGKEYGQNSAAVMVWLTTGVYIASIAYVPYSLLQGVGRPDLSAKVHLVELPLFLLCAWYMTVKGGIIGMAQVWMLRALLDLGVMYYLALRFLPAGRQEVYRSLALMMVGLVLLIPVGAFGLLGLRLAAGCVALVVFLVLGWCYCLAAPDKEFVLGLLLWWRRRQAKSRK